jgi:hypothetical protein
LSHGRALALVGLTIGLVVYGAVAESLWELRSSFDIAVQSLVVFPSFAAVIWLALPLARRPAKGLLAAAALSGASAIVLILIGVDSAANVAKLATFALLGYWFLSLFEELWWVAAVSLLIPWVDIWSVAAGPTRYVVEQRPGVFADISVAFPNPGESTTVGVGPPDIVFFSLFLAAADRFRMRVAWTWLAMTGLLSVTLALVWKLDLSGLPALPAVALGFLLPNADLIWRNVRRAWAAGRERKDASST